METHYDDEVAMYRQSLRGGVKELVDAGIQELPKFYIKGGIQEPPLPRAENEPIPVIDLSKIHDGSTSKAQVIEAISKACEEWGFFQVVNHGVPLGAMDNMIQVVQDFFNLPLEERMEYYSNNPSEPVRFGTSHNPTKESVLEWKDYLRHPCLPLDEVFPKWPKKPSSYREAAKEYCQAVNSLVQILLQLLSMGLGLNPDHLHKAFGKEHLQIMNCNYYPPCPSPELAIGISEHSDIGGLTVLLQNNVEGLEVFHNDHWVLVKPLKNALVVNLGDQSQILTNGKYQSVMHRGRVNSEKLRISVSTFYQPSRSAYICPMPELINDDNPPLYKPCTFGEYFRLFFASELQGKKAIENVKI